MKSIVGQSVYSIRFVRNERHLGKEPSKMIHWAGMEILEEFSEVVDPKHTGLLLWNFSPEVISRCFNGTSVVMRTKALVAQARQHGVRLLYSKPGPLNWQSIGAPMLRMRLKQLRIADSSVADWLPKDHAGKFVEGLEPANKDIVFEKFAPNAFLGTSFEWYLRKHQLKTILLAGAALETGIDGTARDALNLGYYTVIIRDCVGSPFQDTYGAALLSLERVFDVVDSSDIVSAWQSR
jgi:nicotinamidase-related amidase